MQIRKSRFRKGRFNWIRLDSDGITDRAEPQANAQIGRRVRVSLVYVDTDDRRDIEQLGCRGREAFYVAEPPGHQSWRFALHAC
jgi:hypothetical protein